ncbi:cytochrome b [Pseudomonas aeruginosa]|uniref:cytochrome b n=1 Tax=unclassified Pseudomonas TaxID=196821 RepID=UPI0020208558|nr:MULTISPECIES: cytochrome b [unclassified Pseudomonas]URD45495.1 cytochrome b [Pseudomonas sp. BYT-5]URL00678.1 cytochrome b [Pseudomonas sp. BYT-1]
MKTVSADTSVYRAPMRALHWSMALCITALFVSGAIMVEFDAKDSLRAAFYSFHKSIGALIIALFLIRLIVRRLSQVPPLSISMPRWEQRLAHYGHWLLYAMMFAAPLTGWATSDIYGYGVKFFDVPLPKFFPTLGATTGATVGYVHTVVTYIFLGLIGMHLLAVAKHRYIDRDCVMHRMA